MLKLNSILITAGLFCFAVSAKAQSDDEPTISGGIEVTRGAIEQLENELARRAADSTAQLNAQSYKDWNAKFIRQLEASENIFEGRVESEIMQKLQPAIDEYHAIAKNTQLRPDQQAALEKNRMADLNKTAVQLRPVYAAAYRELLKNVIGWLPVVNVDNISETSTHHGRHFWSTFTWDEYLISFDYQIRTVDGKSKLFSGHYQIKEVGYRGIREVPNPIDLVDSDLSHNKPSVVFNKFILPNIEEGCQSDVCVTLKETDLQLTLKTLADQIDRPLQIQVSDSDTVTVYKPNLNENAYVDYFSTTINDSSLPYDDRKQ